MACPKLADALPSVFKIKAGLPVLHHGQGSGWRAGLQEVEAAPNYFPMGGSASHPLRDLTLQAKAGMRKEESIGLNQPP